MLKYPSTIKKFQPLAEKGGFLSRGRSVAGATTAAAGAGAAAAGGAAAAVVVVVAAAVAAGEHRQAVAGSCR